MERKFSVVMALYNTEETLRESIDSIINQSIGFKDNIEVILVDDGSTDGTESICKEYKEKYPENIKYIHKENGGVSSARNYGKKYICGKYTLFFDGDDIWSETAFEDIAVFFDKNYEKIDLCFCRIEYIGDFAYKRYPLDFKFDKGTRITNLITEPKNINVTTGNVVYKTEAILNRNFNEQLHYCEDSLFLNEIVLSNMNCGLVATAIFYYRKNFARESASRSAVHKSHWYESAITEYYLNLYEMSIKKFGKVETFIQEIVMYDLQWRISYFEYVKTLEEEEKQNYYDLIKSVVRQLDDKVILSAKYINQYKKIYLLDLKYDGIWGKPLTTKKGKVFYNGDKIFNFQAKSFINIQTILLEKGVMTIEGFIRNNLLEREIPVYARDSSGVKYELDYEYYKRGELKGVVGESIVEGRHFHVKIPVNEKNSILFLTEFDGKTIKLKPKFEATTGLNDKSQNAYKIVKGYVIKKFTHEIGIFRKKLSMVIVSELRYIKENLSKHGLSWLSGRMHVLRKEYFARHSKIKEQVACVSFRSDEEFVGNLKAVSEHLDVPMISFVGMKPHNKKQQIEACKAIFGSKVVVVDDYTSYLKDYGKRPEQKVIQLWHACGAFKKFGLDGTSLFPSVDALYHKDYDVVTVSSENIRSIYANTFGIDVEKVQALGCARTDVFYDENYRRHTAQQVLEMHPELRDKQVILYAPTFRDLPGKPRSVFEPEFSLNQLSKSLNENQIFVICPHPVIKETIVKDKYDNVIEIRDFSTNDMMFVADLLITDYSSVIFEFSILKKPMVFFCADFDSYDRDFYLDYENDLPGPLLKTEDELYTYLQKQQFTLDEKYDAFVSKYMGACDGKSCERIAEVIKEQLKA